MHLIKHFLLFFCFTFLYSESYPYRDISCPIIKLDEGANIYIITPMRTGSTLIFNIIKYLFEDKRVEINKGRVKKRHAPINNYTHKEIIFTCIRNPLSILASLKNVGLEMSIIDPIKSHELTRKNCGKLVVFKYEEFQNNNFEYIFNILESNLNIQICKKEKDFIEKNFNLLKMKEIQNRYNKFSKHDRITHIHGNHINNSDYRKVFSKEEQ